MEKLRIVFMGTPDFAVGILDTIIKGNYEVVGVITAPDRPAGRGQNIRYSSVKEYALANDLKLLQPLNLKDEGFINELKLLNANLQIVVAFRMLPKVVWEMPKLGTFNLHASLLPDYRGAAPINWAIINGETKTGVTTFFIDDKIDTGAMILKSEIEILPNENAGELHDRLMNLGSKVVMDTMELIEKGDVVTTIQDENEVKTAHKLDKINCKIDWTRQGAEIYNLIRGLSPYPAAWCSFKDVDQEWNVKIYEAEFAKERHEDFIGQIITSKNEIKIAVNDGYMSIKELQLPGKKKMSAGDLLNGMLFTKKATSL